MEKVRHVQRRIEMQAAAGDNQRASKPANQGQQNPHGTALKQGSMDESLGTHDWGGAEFKQCGRHRGDEDGDGVQCHPHFGCAP